MEIGLVGPSYQQRSLPFDAQRSVNLYPVVDPKGKTTSALYGAPGKRIFATAGVGPGRGEFNSTNGRAFVVSGGGFYEVLSNGTTTLRGSLDQSSGIVTMDENGVQLAICDGTSLYIFTYLTNAYAKVVNVNLPSAASVTFIDGYFVVNRSASSGIFQISGLYDGNSWAALDFATAESSPDSLLRVLNIVGQLWLFGARTTEVWTNTGSPSFPFAKIQGAKIETGVWSAYSALSLDNAAFWIGRDTNGVGIVFRADGFTPQRVSTEPIEIRLSTANPATLRAWSYQEDGHTFYVITGGGMETSLALDLSTQQWHERAYLNPGGFYELDKAACGMYAFDKLLVIDRRNGNIYHQSLIHYDDAGDALVRDRIYTHLLDENRRVLYRNLTIGFETGVGLQAGQGSDPQCTLSLSRDGGRTWVGSRMKSIGRVGRYLQRVVFDRLGQSRQMTFRIRMTDPVKTIISGSWLNT